MGELVSEDVTVPWGSAPDPMDVQMGRWRMALYQDAVESVDGKFFYFLYDQAADMELSNNAKGPTGLVVFDIQRRFFVHSIPLYMEGRVKFCYTLKTPSPAGGSTIIIVTHSDKPADQGVNSLLIWRLYISYDGMNLSNEPILISTPLPINDEYIISLREDAPELVVMTTPGFTIWRVNCLAEYMSSPLERFELGAELAHFYDAFVSQGNIYLLSSSPDGHFDPSRIHLVSLSGVRSISTRMCNGDPYSAFPEARKQAAIGMALGFLVLAGGEVWDQQTASCRRLSDYWFLDLTTFTWKKFNQQMPVALIEPRLTSGVSNSVYLWGENDEPFPGIPYGTHIRIIRVKASDKTNMSYPYSPSQTVGVASTPYSYNPSQPTGTTSAPYPYNPSQTTGTTSAPYPYNPSQTTGTTSAPYPYNPSQTNVAPPPYETVVPPSMNPYGSVSAAPPMNPYGSGGAAPMNPYGSGAGSPPMNPYGSGGDQAGYNQGMPSNIGPSMTPYYPPPEDKNKCSLQ